MAVAALPRLLVVHSYEPDQMTDLEQTRGLLSGLAREGYLDGESIDIQHFYMKTKKVFISPEQIEERGREALALIHELKPDLVLTIDDNAARTVMLPLVDSDIPVVFAGMNDQVEDYDKIRHFMNSRARPGHNVTGVLEKLYISKSVRVMKEVLPELGKVVFIVDNTPTGEALEKQVEFALGSDNGGLLYSIWRADSLARYRQFIRKINSDPEIQAYYPLVTRLIRADGSVVPLPEVTRWTLRKCRKPAMAFSYFLAQQGYFGGVSVDFQAMGKYTARKVARILDGTPAGMLPIEESIEYAIVFNVARARQLGITIPVEVLSAADAVYDTLGLRTEPENPTLLIIQSYEEGIGCGAALDLGLVEALAQAGMHVDKNVTIRRFFMDTRYRHTTPCAIHARGQAALREIHATDPDVVVILGDNAIAEVMLPLVGTDYPVLFGGMNRNIQRYNNRKHFMNTLQVPGFNVTGVTSEVFFDKIMEMVHVMLPKARKMVAIMPDTEPWLRDLGERMQRYAESFDSQCDFPGSFQLEQVSSLLEFQRLVLKYSADPSVDLLAVPMPVGLLREDGTVNPLADTLSWLFANQHKPGFTFAVDWVAYGYLMAVGMDLRGCGRQLGNQLIRVLSGSAPGEISIESPEEYYLAVNQARARQLGLRIPLEFLEAARKVFADMTPSLAR
ncbi:ABC transporter substrate-binding protein [Desulfolithobacter sp.]